MPQRAAVARLDPPDDLGALLGVPVGDPRPVRGGEVEVQQPRLAVVVAGDVLARPFGDDPRVVAQVLVLGVALVEVVLAAQAQLGVVLQRPAEVAEELVPAGPGRAVVRQVPRVPLADQRGGVAGLLQQRGQRRVRGLQADRLVGDRLGQPALGTARVAPGVEAEAGRRAGRGARVGVGEPDALAGQPVEVGRLDVRGAVRGEVGPAQVVTQDEQDVGPRARRPRAARNSRSPGPACPLRRPRRPRRGRRPAPPRQRPRSRRRRLRRRAGTACFVRRSQVLQGTVRRPAPGGAGRRAARRGRAGRSGSEERRRKVVATRSSDRWRSRHGPGLRGGARRG